MLNGKSRMASHEERTGIINEHDLRCKKQCETRQGFSLHESSPSYGMLLYMLESIYKTGVVELRSLGMRCPRSVDSVRGKSHVGFLE